MTIKIKKGLIVLLALLFIFNCILFLARPQKASAEEPESEIDYVNQYYRDIPAGFDFINSDAVYKINCPNVRELLGIEKEEEEIDDYITIISFKASMGGQIYFVNGVPCNLEDSIYDDYETDKFSDYYEIVAYDDANKNVYIKFKNLDELEYPEDFAIWNGDAVENAQYIYTSDINKITELTSDKVFFAESKKTLGGSIYSIKQVIQIREDVAHLIDNISVSFSSGGESFTLNKTEFIVEDGKIENGHVLISLEAIGNVFTMNNKVKLLANVHYLGKTLSIESKETDILSIWENIVNNNFQGEENLNVNSKGYIKAYVESIKQSFSSEVKASTFDLYVKEDNKVRAEELIFCFNINDIMGGAIFLVHWSNKVGYMDLGATFEINFAGGQEFFYFSSCIKFYVLNQNGYTSDGESIYTIGQEEISSALDFLDVYVINEKVYIRLKGSAYEYFTPTSNFTIEATNDYNNTINVYSNMATVIYDKYNKELLEEIDIIKNQLLEANKSLSNSNATIDELRERINTLEQIIASLEENISNLETAYNRLDARYNALNEKYVQALTEIENLKAQKNKALEDLLAEVQAHQTTRATLEAQIAEKNGDIESLQAQLDEVNAMLSEKEEALKNAQDDLTALEKRYEELETEYQAFLASSSDELVAISALMHEYRISIAQLKKQVAELQKQLEEEKQEKKEANGCSAGYNGFGGTTGGPGSGVDSTFLMTTLGLTMFAGVVYAKRLRTKKE